MINKKQISIIITFSFLVLLSIVTAMRISKVQLNVDPSLNVQTIEKTIFEGVRYFALSSGEKTLSLDASQLQIVDNEKMFFEFPIGSIFNEGKEIKYKSENGEFEIEKAKLQLSGDVELRSQQGFYKSERFSYDRNNDLVSAKREVESEIVDVNTLDKINIKAVGMNLWPGQKKAEFRGNVNGEIKRKRRYEEGMQFKSSKLQIDLLNSLISLNGNVQILRSNYDLRALRGEIFLENYNKKLKYYVLYDDISLRESMTDKNGQSLERRAYAQKLEGHMATRRIILSGAPRVEQGNDVIKGYQITLREDADIVEVDDSQSRFELKKDE
jgi:LPS export ABC transporter protein LptC/lipopolysaccharide transport protein LptA